MELQFKYLYNSTIDVSPESFFGASAMNGPPGTPSDDEDLPLPLPLSSAPLSPTSYHSFRRNDYGSSILSPESETCPGAFFEEAPSSIDALQGSFSEQLDAIEAPKRPGERPMGSASPKLSSSFPTHTRLSDMLHIDSDEDEDRSTGMDPPPSVINGLKCPVVLHRPKPAQVREETTKETGLKNTETLNLGNKVSPKPEEAHSSVAPQVETISLIERQDEGEEEGLGPSEELATEVDISSMASDCCPMPVSATQVTFYYDLIQEHRE